MPEATTVAEAPNRARRALWVSVAALGVAALTIVVFLVESRALGHVNWPVHFELGKSDNGVLFQFSRDVFTGKPLQWTFSPQVYVFPEIPISLVSYAIAGGSVQGYYVVVAAINNLLLFMSLYAVVRVFYRADDLRASVVRALVASLPLVLLPLVPGTTLFEFALAPTYYFGMYAVLIIAPVLFFTRSRVSAVLLGIGISLTIASDPLTLIFVAAPTVIILVIRAYLNGVRSIARPAGAIAAVLVVAYILRVSLFNNLEGTSPLSYIDSAQLLTRLGILFTDLAGVYTNILAAIVISVGVVALVGGLVIALVITARLSRERRAFTLERQFWMYYGLVPVTGFLLTAALVLLNPLYLWPIVVLPLVFGLLAVPAPRLRAFAVGGSALFAASLVVSLVVFVPSGAPDYFTYRSAETRCLDEKLPAGRTVGYAEYFEARRLELTSKRNIQLIQVDYPGVTNYFWLSNRAVSLDNRGTFFYVDRADKLTQMTVKSVEKEWGPASSSFSCGPGKTVLLYDNPATIEKMHLVYSGKVAP
jgi:hypothetical protein